MQRFSRSDISFHSIICHLSKAAETLLDIILPLKERSARTRERTLEDIELFPTDHFLLGQTITTLMNYKRGAVQDLVQSLKYDKSAHAAALVAELLADFLREEVSSQRTFTPREILLCPVPLHASREQERGYNQIALALEYLQKEFKDGTLARIEPHLLHRTRSTTPQTLLKRSDRLSNVAGAFALTREERLTDKHIYLIDDVTTTGATLVNAQNPLKKAGATVSLIALARA